MTLTSAMMSALSGLRATQSGMSVVANNVANAGSVGYTRKVQLNQQSVTGDMTVGVKSGEITRILDKLVQKQLWTESAGGAYTSTKVDFHSQLDTLFGTPGDDSSLDGIFNTFTQSVQALATSPDSTTQRTEVLNNARVLAQQLNGMSSDIQSMRSGAELQLSSAVDDANEALQGLQRISDQIDKSSTAGSVPAALLDQRDAYISQLSSLMDIKVTAGEGNKISVFTTGGGLLFDGKAATLTFDSQGELGPQSQYSTDPDQRSVGTITLVASDGTSTDMIGAGLIRSGKIGALIELRDKTLPEAQTQLDTLAAKMSSMLSDTQVPGTAATSGAATGFSVDMAGMQNGNPLTISYKDGGVARKAVFVEVSADTPLPLPASANGGADNTDVIGYTGGPAGAQAAVAAKLGAGFSVSLSGSTLTVLDDGAAGTTDVTGLTATRTNTALTGNGAALPFFIDGGKNAAYTASMDGGVPQRTGFAGRISVNPALLSNSALLVQYDTSIQSGDSRRPQAILDALTSTPTTFEPDTGIGGSAAPYTGSVGAFARSVVETQARNSQTIKSIDAGQQIVVNSLSDKMAATSGVNIDDEMSNLLQLQNAYAANARVMSTVRDMLQTLMNM